MALCLKGVLKFGRCIRRVHLGMLINAHVYLLKLKQLLNYIKK